MSSPSRHLTPDDNLFVAMERLLGSPVINQTVWQLGPDVDEAFLGTVAQRLRRGRLSRLVVPALAPGRDRWLFTPKAGVFSFESDAIDAGQVSSWARREHECAEVSSVHGPAWWLRGVHTTDGRTVVSLTLSHVIGDGAAVIAGVEEAVRAEGLRPGNASTPTPREVLTDMVSSLALAARASVQLVRQPKDSVPTAPTASEPVAVRQPLPDAEVSPTTSVVVDSGAFDEAARPLGGTANTLFTAVVLGVLAKTGRVADGDEVPVTLPMSMRTGAGDWRANATRAVTASLSVSAGRYDDLTELRRASKAAFATAGQDRELDVFLQVAQALPDWLVRRLAGNPTTPLCVASNLGELSTDFASLGGRTVGRVAMRATTIGRTTPQLAAAGGGIGAWAARSGGQLTLSFASQDPVLVADAKQLQDIVIAVLENYGLAAEPWL